MIRTDKRGICWNEIRREPGFNIEYFEMEIESRTEGEGNIKNQVHILSNFGKVTPGRTVPIIEEIFNYSGIKVEWLHSGNDLVLIDYDGTKELLKSRGRILRILSKMRDKNLTGFNSPVGRPKGKGMIS